MLETEYDEKKTMELFRKEGWTEGHTEGRKEGIQVAISLCRELGMDDDSIIKKIAEKFGLTAESAACYVSSTTL